MHLMKEYFKENTKLYKEGKNMDYYSEIEKILKSKKIRNKGGKRKYENKNGANCNSISFDFTI